MTSINMSQHSGPSGRFIVKEMLHFQDGTVAEHCTKETTALLTKFHDLPPVNNFGIWVVPASPYYLASWQDINPSIRNVTFAYRRIS
jgi:hypothetical protein